MGEVNAMVQVAQIQFSRRGWGRIYPDVVQARRWIEYGASRGDPTSLAALQNLRTALVARERDLAIARDHGLIDFNQRTQAGHMLSPSEQVGLPPIEFSRLITKDPLNVLEATSEELALKSYVEGKYRPLSEILKNSRKAQLASNTAPSTAAAGAPSSVKNKQLPPAPDFRKMTQQNNQQRLERVQSSLKSSLDYVGKLVNSRQITPPEAESMKLRLATQAKRAERDLAPKPDPTQISSSSPQRR